MFTVLVIIQIITAVALIIMVLIQHGKGAEAGAALSSGSQSVLGTASGGSIMTRITASLAVVFIVNSLVMASLSPKNENTGSLILKNNQTQESQTNGDVPNIPLPQ